MVYVTHFKCLRCGEVYTIEELGKIPRCTICNSALDVVYDYDSIRSAILKDDFMRAPPSHWKYWAFLPAMDLSRIVTLGEGHTPLLENKRLTGFIEAGRVLIKYEAMNPTGSFKDRGSSLEVTKALELKNREVALASTGNMGASVAAYAAFAGLKCRVYVPAITPPTKIKQMEAYGAEVVRVDGDYVDAMRLAEKYVMAQEDTFLTGDYVWRCEGTKTVGFEILDQLYWRTPDAIFVPIGNGTLTWGLYSALKDLARVGITERIPRIIGVQAEGCSPIVKSWEEGVERITPVHDPQTVASALACGDPIYGLYALRAIRESRGTAVTVSDSEILHAQKLLGAHGIFVEPSGAVAYAGALKIKEKLDEQVIVALATGHGLKGI
jgi:threonine synthase